MTIWMIWAVGRINGTYWLVDAWDDDSVSGNYEGWQEAKEKAIKDYGYDNVSITTTVVNMTGVIESFNPTEV